MAVGTGGTAVGEVPALKEWGAVAHALLAGRQCLLLRKGGIHERRFVVGAPRPVLFPTVAHSHAEDVRPEHHDLLAPGAADSTDERVVVRCALAVRAVVPVERPEHLDELAPLHVWTTASAARRLDFRPRHLLTALVVEARPLLVPVEVARRPEHRGCSSWLDLAADLPGRPALGPPALDDAALAEAGRRVRSAVGGPGDADR